MSDEFLTVDQAAELAGKRPKTIRRWFSEGRLTRYRVGVRGVRVHRGELDKMITPVAADPAREEAV